MQQAPAQPPIEVTASEWAIVTAILRRYVSACPVWAFGSRAMRRAKPYSDLDLAIITPAPMSIALSAALAQDFADSDLPFKVDVVDWATTGEAFRKIIEQDRVVLRFLHDDNIGKG